MRVIYSASQVAMSSYSHLGCSESHFEFARGILSVGLKTEALHNRAHQFITNNPCDALAWICSVLQWISLCVAGSFLSLCSAAVLFGAWGSCWIFSLDCARITVKCPIFFLFAEPHLLKSQIPVYVTPVDSYHSAPDRIISLWVYRVQKVLILILVEIVDVRTG